MEVMAYELRALEAALLIVVQILESEVSTLEARTGPGGCWAPGCCMLPGCGRVVLRKQGSLAAWTH